jgi:flagellar motor switch protein FliG
MGVSDNFIGLLQRTSDSFIRDNIYMVDISVLAMALNTVEPQHQDKVFRNMTDEGAAAVKEMMASLGTISAADVEAAQQEIISLASQAM